MEMARHPILRKARDDRASHPRLSAITPAQGLICVRSDPWAAPELGNNYLVGDCPDRVRSNPRITTSRIVAAQGRLVTTESGSVYLLGEADPAYVEFLKSIGRELDESNPVTVT